MPIRSKLMRLAAELAQAEDYLEIFRVAFKNAGEGVDKERVAIAVMQEMGKDKRMQLALLQQREQGRQQRATR